MKSFKKKLIILLKMKAIATFQKYETNLKALTNLVF
jgi:hypothetical protein